MSDRLRRRVVWARAILGYLCLLTVFSTFLTCVHHSLQEKQSRYIMGEMLNDKVELQREVSLARARVEDLRRLERLEDLCREGRLSLGPPKLPPLMLPMSSDSLNEDEQQAESEKTQTPSPADHGLGGIALAARDEER
ncbi:MAG: hypothetical protein ABIH23_04755 [bacterium]